MSDINMTDLTVTAFANSLIARAQCAALVEFIIPDDQKASFNKCVKEKLKKLIEKLKDSPNSELYEEALKQLNQQE